MPPLSAQTALQILPYAVLLEELQVATIRELEDLIIDAIYLDVLRGKLDQKEQQLEIEYTMGRDLAPGKLQNLLEALQNWSVPSRPPS
jgi:COP9 signalosome complex subunit 7